MMSVASSQPGEGGFLKFSSGPPRIFLTDLSPHPSERLLLAWKEEGFDATYLPYDPSAQTAYGRTLKSISNSLKLGEMYAIVAYGEAASVVLKTATKPLAKCCAIVAFYPSVLPGPKTMYPKSSRPQIHVAGLSQASPRSEMCEWKLYRYEDCAFGFADPSSDAYSEVEANLSWSRALACVRRGFQKEVDLEPVMQGFWNSKYEDDVPDCGSMGVVQNMTQHSLYVSILPTMEGGIGRKKLQEFYREFFIPSLVDDFKVRLVSRTIGAERVVDEMVVSFTHSDEIDWILPGIQPTDTYVEIPMVSGTWSLKRSESAQEYFPCTHMQASSTLRPSTDMLQYVPFLYSRPRETSPNC
jgi:carboxymethylenebutenolidase